MSDIKNVKLGSQALVVPAIGLGCMGMTRGFGAEIYGKADEKEAIATIHRSFELGGNFFRHSRHIWSISERKAYFKSYSG